MDFFFLSFFMLTIQKKNIVASIQIYRRNFELSTVSLSSMGERWNFLISGEKIQFESVSIFLVDFLSLSLAPAPFPLAEIMYNRCQLN